MHNKVVHRIARGLRRAGAVVLRFNYRGVNLSEGVYDEGTAKSRMHAARCPFCAPAIRTCPTRWPAFPSAPESSCAWAANSGAERLIAAGFPANFEGSAELGHCARPKLFVQSTHDQYGSVPAMEAYFAALPDPKTLKWVEAADHFFAHGLEAFEEAVYEQVNSL